jgi:biopolymer transport protein ExbD
MPVSLARGTIDLDFDLNVHAFYSIDIGRPQRGNLICRDGAGLRTRRISSVGELPVYRYQWVEDESRALGGDVIAGEFLGGFEGRCGHYHLRIEVLSDTACLDADNPRLYIFASNEDFFRWNKYYESACWILFVLGAIGFGLLIVGLRERLRNRPTNDLSLSFFEPRPTDNYAARQRVKAAPWIPFFSQVGLLYSQILPLLVICGVLVFHFAWGYDRRSQGLFVAVGLPPVTKDHTCGEAWVVRIDAKQNWYLNSAKTSQSELAGLLNQKLEGRSNCAVYFDGDPSLSFAVAIQAIDTIQNARAMVVVLSTPKTKDSHLRRPR